MTTLAALIVGIFIGAAIVGHNRQQRDAQVFALGIEAQKDADHLGVRANHPAYAGGPRPAPPTLTIVDHDDTTNVIPLSRRQGPEPAA